MVPFRACIGANVDVDGERHMCSALLLLAGVSCSSCCMHSVLRAAATLCSVPHLSCPGLQRRKRSGRGKAVTRLARLGPVVLMP